MNEINVTIQETQPININITEGWAWWWTIIIDNDNYLWVRDPNTNTWIDKNWVTIPSPAIVSKVWVISTYYICWQDATSDPWIDNIAGNIKQWDTVFFDWTNRTSQVNIVQPHTHQANEIESTDWNVQTDIDEIKTNFFNKTVDDADDIDDTTSINKFTTQADIDRLANTSWPNTGDQDLTDYFNKTTDDTEDITETANKVFVTPAEKTAITHTNRAALDLVTGENTWDQDLTNYLDKTTDTYLEDVVAWTNVTIDKTDPKNPVISSTGTGWWLDEESAIAYAVAL